MVLGGAHGFPWVGSAVGLLLVGTHLYLSRERGPEVATILLIGAMGTLVDSAQAFAGVFVFESGYWTYWVVPFWLTVMWMQFATLFHFILSWLSGRYLLSHGNELQPAGPGRSVGGGDSSLCFDRRSFSPGKRHRKISHRATRCPGLSSCYNGV